MLRCSVSYHCMHFISLYFISHQTAWMLTVLATINAPFNLRRIGHPDPSRGHQIRRWGQSANLLPQSKSLESPCCCSIHARCSSHINSIFLHLQDMQEVCSVDNTGQNSLQVKPSTCLWKRTRGLPVDRTPTQLIRMSQRGTEITKSMSVREDMIQNKDVGF